MTIKRIIKGVSEFQNNYFNEHQEMFQQLSLGQNPEILFITCCDSRIDPNLMTQTKPGDLFIIRNFGNIIPPHSAVYSGEGATLEYAILSLNIKHIVICGHSHCGSMKALLRLQEVSEEMPIVYNWLKIHGESTRRLLKENYTKYEGEELLKIAIAENVLTQVENLETYPIIRSRMHAGTISLHAWVYEIETGKIFAYDASKGEYVILDTDPFPVPNPLAMMQHK
jgi:carbonic anhydrase